MADSEKLHLLIAELRDFYDVERQLTRAVSKLPEGNSWCALRDAFEMHLTETRREISRLEHVVKAVWETDRNRREEVPAPAPDTAVRIPIRSSASVGPTGVPHSREDYDDGDDNTLVAWARAIGYDEPGDDRPGHLVETESGGADPNEPSTTNNRPPS